LGFLVVFRHSLKVGCCHTSAGWYPARHVYGARYFLLDASLRWHDNSWGIRRCCSRGGLHYATLYHAFFLSFALAL